MLLKLIHFMGNASLKIAGGVAVIKIRVFVEFSSNTTALILTPFIKCEEKCLPVSSICLVTLDLYLQ